MKKHPYLWLFFCLFLFAASEARAQKTFTESRPTADTISCRAVTLNCDCTNPKRKFVVENQKIGRINPGDPGVCQSSIYIDDWLQRNTYTACVRGSQEGFDPNQRPACKATWSCKEPCSVAPAK